MKEILDVPQIWALGALIMVWLVNKFLPIYNFEHYTGAWAPFFVGIVGLIYCALGERILRKNNTSIETNGIPSTLITTGIFKVSRNPIYTGYALIILAFIIQQGDIIGALVLGLFVWVITKRFIKPEEEMILANFPEAKPWFEATNRW